MTRTQKIAFMTGVVLLFTVFSIAALVVINDQRRSVEKQRLEEQFQASQEASDRVLALYQNVDTTVPTCYMNKGYRTYPVPCDSQAVVNAKDQYDREVDDTINELGQLKQQH